MQQLMYDLSFDDVSAADASYFAEELRRQLLDTLPTITVTRVREDRYTQDAGTILQIVLSASSVAALASALGSWLVLHRKASITIKRDGELCAKNITSRDAVRLAEMMYSQQSHQKEHSTPDDNT
jgi:hypothetical protein